MKNPRKKLQARINTYSVEMLISMLRELEHRFDKGTDIVFEEILNVLMHKMPEDEFLQLSEELYA